MNPILIGYAILQIRQHSEQLISADRCTLYCKVSTPDKASLLQYNTKVHNNTSPIYTTGRFAGRLHTFYSIRLLSTSSECAMTTAAPNKTHTTAYQPRVTEIVPIWSGYSEEQRVGTGPLLW